MLTLRDIEYQYPESQWRIAIPHQEIHAGELLGIVGPNGSGKSTMVRIAAGLLRPQRGEVRLGSADPYALPRRVIARRIGYLPQRVMADHEFSVLEVVALGRFPHQRGIGFLTSQDRAVIDRVLSMTELTAFADRYFKRLSGGEQQRVLLASILAQEPEIMLLDEPTSALDAHHGVQFFRLLRKLAAEGPGIAVVTHDSNLAAGYCDRILLLKDGTPVCCGPAAEVFVPSVMENMYRGSVIIGQHPQTGGPVLLPSLKE